MRVFLRCSLVGAALLLASCGDSSRLFSPSADTLSAQRAKAQPGVGVNAPGFFWLAPTVPGGGPFTGVFDGSQQPTITIVCVTAIDPACPTLATLSVSAPGLGNIAVDVVGNKYRASWIAPSTLELGSGKYRIEVRVGTDLVGQGDLQVESTASAAAKVPRTHIAVIRGRSLPIVFRLESGPAGGQLPGLPTNPAVAAITLAKAPANNQALQTGHPALPGLPTSVTDAMVHIAASATIGEVNEALRVSGGTIIGGVPGVPTAVSGLLVVRFETSTHAELEARLTLLRAQPGVLGAMADAALATEAAPASSASTPEDWEWSTARFGGNWGLKHMRVPAMWNLNETVQRDGVLSGVGVFDAGFFEHEDLVFNSLVDNVVGDEHGSHVSGIIAAGFNNGRGVDGMNPFARLNGEVVQTISMLITGLATHIERLPTDRVINVSLGYSWSVLTSPVNAISNAFAQTRARFDGNSVQIALRSLEARGRTLPVIAAAAGNESNQNGWGQQPARFSSPLTNAALEQGVAAIVVVESISDANVRVPSSNVGGHMAAPGGGVLSTTQGTQYGQKTGTSMAAPHIAGLFSYLYSADPSLPAPTLATNPMRDLLLRNSRPVIGSDVPSIDGFRALMDIDRLQGNARLLRALLDIDDGSSDGNLRVNGFGLVMFSNDFDGNGRLGDGQIDMSDFRKFRDHLIDIENIEGTVAAPLFLNGAATHPKRDLNADGVVNDERRWSRADFNGDGRVSRTAVAQMSGVLDGQSLTDLQVLASQFDDPHYAVADLPELLSSADVTLNLTACIPGSVYFVRIRARQQNSQSVQQERLVPSAQMVQVFTVPVAANGYDFELTLLANDGLTVLGNYTSFAPAELGMDTFVTPTCSKPVVTVAPNSANVLYGGTVQFTASVTNSSNTAVTWTATGGTISATGLYTAGSTEGIFSATATSVADPTVIAPAQVIVSSPVAVPNPAISFGIVSGSFGGRPTSPIRYRVRFTSYPGYSVTFSTSARGTGEGWVPNGPIDPSSLTPPAEFVVRTFVPTTADEYRVDWFAEVTYPPIWLSSVTSPGVDITTKACYFLPTGEPMLGAGGAPLCSTITRSF